MQELTHLVFLGLLDSKVERLTPKIIKTESEVNTEGAILEGSLVIF